MTHQMPPGAQIAFAKDWLEKQGIESQTIDVTSHIDPSLSYEENIKIIRRRFGLGGGRSRQQATREMTAAECDVAIGNYEAGFNHEITRDACQCGHPDACEKLERQGAAAAEPKLKTVKDAKQWMEKKVREYGSRNALTCSSEYKKRYPELKVIYDRAKKQKKEERKRVNIVKNPYGTGYAIKLTSKNAYVGGAGPMGMGADIATFETIDKAVEEAKRLGYEVTKTKPTAYSRQLNKTREAIELKMQKEASKLRSGIGKEIRALKPMGQRSEIGIAMSVMPKRGVCVDTPLGEVVFAKHRQPSREQLERWGREKSKSDQMYDDSLELAFSAVGEGYTIGNKKALETGEKLLKKGLLTPDEKAYVLQLRKFWREHPHAKSGTVRGGKIVEWIPVGGTPSAKPKIKPAATPKRKPAPAIDLPPALTAPPELAADVLGGSVPPTAAPKRKPSAAKPRKTAKKPAKPKAKKTAATPKLTAAQREYLAIQGFVMVKRGGKFVKVTR